jgi:hypothetical protein
MVAPLVAMAAASVISAGIQWYNSRQAQNASESERERIADLLNSIKDPNFDERNINPEDVALLQKYVPETSPYIKEIAPQTVQALSQGAVQGRDAQMQSLGMFQKLMQQGYDPQTAMEMARAQRGASAEATSARNTAQAEANRRGFGGGPSFYQAGASQAGQDRMAQLQSQALADASQRRMQAAGQAANLGGDIRSSDINLERGNIDIINAYNQRMANSQQDWANQGANVRNAANLRNITEGQRIDELNKTNKYNAALGNQSRQNTLAQQKFNNNMGRVTGQTAQAQWATQNAQDNAATNNRAIQSATDLAANMGGMYYQNQQNQQNKADWLQQQQDQRSWQEKQNQLNRDAYTKG